MLSTTDQSHVRHCAGHGRPDSLFLSAYLCTYHLRKDLESYRQIDGGLSNKVYAGVSFFRNCSCRIKRTNTNKQDSLNSNTRT